MNKQGAIASFETESDAKAAGYTTPLTAAEAAQLLGRNRHERRAALAEMRRKARKEQQK